MEFLQQKFSADIKAKRGVITLRKIADQINVSPATINRIERGNLPDLLTYAVLCKWLNTPVDTYFEPGYTDKIKDVLLDMVHEMQAIGQPCPQLIKKINQL